MSSKLRIFSYNPGSQGAKAIAQAMGIKRIKHEGSKYKPKPTDTIINWGCSRADRLPHGAGRIWNDPDVVARASNKLAFFQHLQSSNVRTPDWTSDPATARTWIDAGHLVVARTVLSGHSGAGIKILELGVDFVDAPLYTKYVKKEKEFRVHCGFGNVIDVQRKIKRPDFIGEPNWRIRNHQSGFIYVRDNVEVPEDVSTQALEAFKASGLHFGAIDVLWNAHSQRGYVLEINTAPGVVGRTVESYTQAFSSALDGPPV